MNFIANLASSLLDEQEKFTDLTQVSVVDADACLDVLKKRFDNQSIYTHCGPLLVAVNPYTEIEGLYSDSNRISMETQVTFEDGRTGAIKAEVELRDVSAVTPVAKAS